MRRLCFPQTNRVHGARQKLLLDELRKHFEVDIFEPRTKNEGSMSAYAILCAIEFNNFLSLKKYDGVLIRGDRFELMGCTMVAAYKGIPIFHIEAGDSSGVIDDKVRHAISKLSDYHFPTNEEARVRLINMGCDPNKVFDFGSLDVEFAKQVESKKPRDNPFILVCYHPIQGEDENELVKALENFKEYEIISTVSNKDYGRTFGDEYYSPEDYINLMRFASCCVGNSSSLLKEASILSVPVVLVGGRQKNRLTPSNVLNVPCESEKIKLGITYQLTNSYKPDTIYFKEESSKRITQTIQQLLN